MNLIFFPLIELGPFAIGVGLGIAPALLSLAMLLTYSLVLGIVYAALDSPCSARPPLRRGGRTNESSDINIC